MMNQLRGRLAAEAAAAAASEAVTAVGAAASAASEDSHNNEEVILHSYAKFLIIHSIIQSIFDLIRLDDEMTI